MQELSARISHGILNFPGRTPESQKMVEIFLAGDRERHHCFFGRVGLHNHLSHHLLASYDLGASAQLLEATFYAEAKELSPLHLADRSSGLVQEQTTLITVNNWTDCLGQEKYYACYLQFFTAEILAHGPGEVIEEYVFASAANDNESHMLLRFVGGALHPLIQTGYAAEFGSEALLAQALAQTAVHKPFVPELFEISPIHDVEVPEDLYGGRRPARGHSLLYILRQVYDSPILEPVLPYDSNTLLSTRIRDTTKGGRPAEIRRLCALWGVTPALKPRDYDEKIEELFWLATLLLAGTSKPERMPRLDFFLMHVLNATLFLPSLMKLIPSAESKARLLNAYLPVIFMYLLLRGRPRIDPKLIMTYSATPHPPFTAISLDSQSSAIGDPRNVESMNPWPAIISSVLHAPDAHTIKAIRSLYYAAQQYGDTHAGGLIGATDEDGEGFHEGITGVDGTVFVRAAGVVMDVLGWVTYGQKAGHWDMSGLGWEDAWKTEKTNHLND